MSSKDGRGGGPDDKSGFKKRREKNSHLEPMSDVLQGLLQNGKSRLADGFLRWRLEREWPSIVGDMISQNSLPCAYSHGTLHIWVRSSAWMQQLWFFQDMIREKVNVYVGSEWVKEVRFTLSRRAAVTGDETKRD
jgi:predicted nucleic acid-binding Zn ribbon protein